jgi:hypothetical protein
MPFSRTDYTCAFQCGFAGSFEIVSAHEANCALNPQNQNFRQMPLHASPLHASRTPPGKEPGCPQPIQGSSLRSDVSTYRQALSSTHSIDTPTNILEISNQPEPQNYRRVPLHASSGFGQFEKAGPQTPLRKEPEHHFSIARSFTVPGLNKQGNAVPGAIKMQKQICEFCKKLIPPSTPEAKTAHEQVEAGVGEPCVQKKIQIRCCSMCARVQILGLGRPCLIRLHFFPAIPVWPGLSFERSPTTGWYYVISIVSESPAESCCSIQLMVSLPHPYASIRCYLLPSTSSMILLILALTPLIFSLAGRADYNRYRVCQPKNQPRRFSGRNKRFDGRASGFTDNVVVSPENYGEREVVIQLKD